jgi:hypothetical protein
MLSKFSLACAAALLLPACEPAALPEALHTLVPQSDAQTGAGGHTMELPGGGPSLKIRGFFDFNYGMGSIANPLVVPIADNGCGTCGDPPTPPHSLFQAGEFDLFMTPRLTDRLSFLSKIILGPVLRKYSRLRDQNPMLVVEDDPGTRQPRCAILTNNGSSP